MWKAAFPAMAALLAVSVPLASGEGARRGADQEEQQPQTRSSVSPGTALVFFSGFGIQASRKTYLIPVNAQIWIEDDVRRAGVSVEPILGELDSRGAGAKLVVLDASRRNPFERRFRGFSAGLAGIYAPDDTLVMYSAAPGKVANDDGGEHSAMISELIAQIRAPGQSAEDVFIRTRVSVSQASQRKQVPWVSSSMIERFFFGSR
jgi:uncharacterized caspase-like protein